MSYVWKLYLNLALGCIDIVILLYPKPKCLNQTQNGYKWFFWCCSVVVATQNMKLFFLYFRKRTARLFEILLLLYAIWQRHSKSVFEYYFLQNIFFEYFTIFFYRRLSKSQVHFHPGTCTRGVFKTQLNIYDRAFLQK